MPDYELSHDITCECVLCGPVSPQKDKVDIDDGLVMIDGPDWPAIKAERIMPTKEAFLSGDWLEEAQCEAAYGDTPSPTPLIACGDIHSYKVKKQIGASGPEKKLLMYRKDYEDRREELPSIWITETMGDRSYMYVKAYEDADGELMIIEEDFYSDW